MKQPVRKPDFPKKLKKVLKPIFINVKKKLFHKIISHGNLNSFFTRQEKIIYLYYNFTKLSRDFHADFTIVVYNSDILNKNFFLNFNVVFTFLAELFFTPNNSLA